MTKKHTKYLNAAFNAIVDNDTKKADFYLHEAFVDISKNVYKRLIEKEEIEAEEGSDEIEFGLDNGEGELDDINPESLEDMGDDDMMTMGDGEDEFNDNDGEEEEEIKQNVVDNFANMKSVMDELSGSIAQLDSASTEDDEFDEFDENAPTDGEDEEFDDDEDADDVLEDDEDGDDLNASGIGSGSESSMGNDDKMQEALRIARDAKAIYEEAKLKAFNLKKVQSKSEKSHYSKRGKGEDVLKHDVQLFKNPSYKKKVKVGTNKRPTFTKLTGYNNPEDVSKMKKL